jgi:hypothetical protein
MNKPERFLPTRLWLSALGWLAAIAIAGFSVVMLDQIVPYLKLRHAYSFLGTKSDDTLAKPHFQVSFYLHITSSMVVIVMGLLQFFPTLVQRYPLVHRRVGMAYILLILLLAAPSGLVLGLYANHGLPAKVGFVLQSIVWWGITLAAWHEIRQHRYLPHIDMMIRSFALTLAAMSLRSESYALYYWLGTKPQETYLTVTWLSWVGNLLLAELAIYAGLGRFFLRKLR